MWNTFGLRTLKEYLELYLFSDVCLLADVFEAYRQNYMKYYNLNPEYFLSVPQLAWNSLLRFIKLPIELMHDSEMYGMIHFSIRGGICYASVRYARANNKYMGSFYRPYENSVYILYVDFTNLYG